jgi:hypothetical protein
MIASLRSKISPGSETKKANKGEERGQFGIRWQRDIALMPDEIQFVALTRAAVRGSDKLKEALIKLKRPSLDCAHSAILSGSRRSQMFIVPRPFLLKLCRSATMFRSSGAAK